MVTTPVLLSAAVLLLLLPPATPTEIQDSQERRNVVPIKVVVQDSIHNSAPLIYKTKTVHQGILLGSLRTLQDSNSGFKFTYKEDPNYGPYLESVNGVHGNDEKHTYWELLVRTQDGEIKRPDVGIGCYIPNEKDEIILNYTKW